MLQFNSKPILNCVLCRKLFRNKSNWGIDGINRVWHKSVMENENAPDTKADPKPAYVTYTTFDNFINGLKESGIPNRIDKSVMSSMSGSTQSFLMGALRFLNLISASGLPMPELKLLVEADAASRKKELNTTLHIAYDFLLNKEFNLKAATLSEVEQKFREKGLGGDTIRKAISFFTLACDAAGIVYSPHLKGKKGVRGNGSTRRPRKQKSEDTLPTPPHKPVNAGTIQQQLLQKFPEFNPTWDAEMQKKWFTSFEQFMKIAKSEN